MIPPEIKYDLGYFKVESEDKTLNSIFFSHIIKIKKCDLIEKDLEFEFLEYYVNSDTSDLLKIYDYFLTRKNINLTIVRGLFYDSSVIDFKTKYTLDFLGGFCNHLFLPRMNSDRHKQSESLICLKFKTIKINGKGY